MKVAAHLYMELSFVPDFSRQEWKPAIWSFRIDDSERRLFVRDIEVEIDAPADFNPVPQQVAALEKDKLEALEEYQDKVAAISLRLAKLMAITMTNEVEA